MIKTGVIVTSYCFILSHLSSFTSFISHSFGKTTVGKSVSRHERPPLNAAVQTVFQVP